MKPFIVEGVGTFLKWLMKLNIFQHFLRMFPRLDKQTRGGLIELWILTNLLLSIILLSFLPIGPPSFVRIPVVLYAILRLLEVVVFQVYTQIYGGYPGKKKTRLHYNVLSYRRSIFIALMLYLEAIVWFAVLYRLNCGSFSYTGISLSDPIKALYYSFVTMTTIGYGDVYPVTYEGFTIVIAHSLTAILMTVLIIARIISYLPGPRTLDEVEREPMVDEPDTDEQSRLSGKQTNSIHSA
jgi:hypothetical protein